MKILKLLPIIGISILVYIIYKIGPIKIYKTLITANLFYVFLSLAFMFLGIFFLVFKWYIILKIQDIHINFLYAVKIYFIGIFYGTITPARSGSIIRASYLKDTTNKSFGECVSSIILERLMDLFIIFVLSIMGCIVFSKYISGWLPIFLIFFAIFLLSSLFLLKKNMNKLILKFIYKFLIPERLKGKSKEIYNAFYSNIPPFKRLTYPLILTLITWIIFGIHIYYITKAYSVDVSLFYIILIFVIGTAISLIPITVGGLGTREAVWIFLFSLFNIPAAKVVSISFLGLLLSSLLPPLIGFLFSLKEQPEGLI